MYELALIGISIVGLAVTVVMLIEELFENPSSEPDKKREDLLKEE